MRTPVSSKVETVTIRIYRPDGREACRCNFPMPFYQAIERARKKMKIGLEEFFMRAIRRNLRRDNIPVQAMPLLKEQGA